MATLTINKGRIIHKKKKTHTIKIDHSIMNAGNDITKQIQVRFLMIFFQVPKCKRLHIWQ